MSGSVELDQANALVDAYAASQGAAGRQLDADGDVSFGETGLHYVASEHAIYGRTYVTLALTKDATIEWLSAYRRMTIFLNDPKVGGMYDHAGAYFFLDEKKEAYFLVRKFDIATTNPDQLINSMEQVKLVAAHWTMKWFVEVSDIMHGTREPPKAPVTAAN